MKLPTPKRLATKDIKVQIANGTDENGVLNIVDVFDVKCRFEQSNSVAYTKEGEKLTLKGKAFIFEKLEKFPDDASGLCTVGEIQYDIVHSSKKYDPYGSINHIVLELI